MYRVGLNQTTKRKIFAASVLSRESSSLQSYLSNFAKWRSYANLHNKPAMPVDNELFSSFLLDSVNKYSWQVIKQVIASVGFFLKALGLPKMSSSVLLQDYVMKNAAKPVLTREPVLVSHLQKIFRHVDFSTCSLYMLRNVAILIVGLYRTLCFMQTEFN